MARVFCAAMTVLTLSGCATLSERECLTADWQGIGYEDGTRGYPLDRIASHRKTCAEHAMKPDFGAYRQGWAEGLVHYCTLGNGLSVGRQGYSYASVCPHESESEFLRGYQIGREIHATRSALSSVSSRLRGLQTQLESGEPDAAERDEIRHRMRSLDREYGRLERELRLLDDEAYRLVSAGL